VGISYLKSFIAVKDLGSTFYWSRAYVSLKRGWGNGSDTIGDERPIEGTISYLCGLIFIQGTKLFDMSGLKLSISNLGSRENA
jgi:hypothetical protein